MRRLLINDLKSIRCSRTRLSQIATRRLFSEIVLKPTKDSISRWNHVIQNNRLRQLPHKVTIWSYKDIDIDMYRYNPDEEYDEFNSNAEGDADIDSYQEHKERRKQVFFDAVKALDRLPRTDSVILHSTTLAMGIESANKIWTQPPPEDLGYRISMLETLFTGILSHNDTKGNSTIRSLTLKNLQNLPIPDFTSSDLFTAVTSKLDELHIQMTVEVNEHGPDHDLDKEERRTFLPHLVERWLKPMASNLKRLSLYSVNDNWGSFPGKFETSSLLFPQLEELSLGYYTIDQDDQLDWILSCKSLKRLNFHNVMVLSHISISNHNVQTWSVNTNNWRPIPDPENPDGTDYGFNCFRYETKWAYFLDRIADELPNLTEFSFDFRHTEENDTFDIERRNDLGLHLGSKRYVAFWDGILPNPWPEADQDNVRDGSIEWCGVDVNPHQETIIEDSKSFDRLCRILRERREKSR
ncbi:hypothetical protein H2203_009124 [Taxawa tesnikishii (nom. ined.)]|nr:hypothetical protein H2203_009124 [Dothideales sp. JES 119]